MAARPNASDMTNEFAEARVTYRGVEYVMRELSMDEYDKTIKLATSEKDGEEVFDDKAHIKILTAKSLVSPKMTPGEINALGTRIVRGLQVKVGQLHWEEEPETKADDDEGEAPAPPKP